jgi:toxin ParE1/3/4
VLLIAWSKGALRDLEDITTYIAIDNEAAAEQLREHIEQSVLPAAEHPYLFRAGRRNGTREIVPHPNYIVVYRILTDRIRVIAVIHTRRRYP